MKNSQKAMSRISHFQRWLRKLDKWPEWGRSVLEAAAKMEGEGGVTRRKHKALEKERFRFPQFLFQAQHDNDE